MNEKFWDLKKDRQDCMINGSLKVFARCGYRHASTDEIVAEAGVSKGLIFHYFHSKNGLYEFLAEYSARFSLVELESELRKSEHNREVEKESPTDFFELQRKLVRAEARILRQYPYMLLFIERVKRDPSCENPDEVLSAVSLYSGRREKLLGLASLPESLPAAESAMIADLLDLERSELVMNLLGRKALSPDRYAEGMHAYIRMFERMYTHKL